MGTPVGILLTSDQPIAEAATYIAHIHMKRTSVPSAGFEPGDPSIQAGCRLTPLIALLPGLATYIILDCIKQSCVNGSSCICLKKVLDMQKRSCLRNAKSAILRLRRISMYI